MRRLLFLNGIKAFEAAARSGSFAGAGAELNVSAAAPCSSARQTSWR
jgi:LysR family transcriptional regulator, glycine cleavage system transcriptional activator